MVYNHTGEGGSWIANDSSTYNVLSFRGLDNPTYYSLTADMQFNWDNTGVGGNYNTFNPTAQDLIIHSLAYWKDTLGVDGFRFDLASVLGNTCQHGCFNYDKMNTGTALNRIMRDLSPRAGRGRRGHGLHRRAVGHWRQLVPGGQLPGHVGRVERHLRDTFRKDQNQMGVENVTPGNLATRFAGSSDLYGDDGRKPFNSINFMVAHDGFTLKDLYSLQQQEQQPGVAVRPLGRWRGQQPQLGPGRHRGRPAQGGAQRAGVPDAERGHADVHRRRRVPAHPVRQQQRVQPGLGQELAELHADARTRRTSRRSAQRLIAFRKAHPALRPPNFYSTVDTNGNVMEQHRWFKPDGTVPDAAYFDSAQQPRAGLPRGRHGVRRHGQRHLRGLQRLVRRR